MTYLLKPVLYEEGFAAHVCIRLLQDMLTSSLKNKSPEEINNFLKSRLDPFLSNAQVASKEELLDPNAQRKFGLWLRDYERIMLMLEIPFWTGKHKLMLDMNGNAMQLQSAQSLSNSGFFSQNFQFDNTFSYFSKYQTDQLNDLTSSTHFDTFNRTLSDNVPKTSSNPTYQSLVLFALNAAKIRKLGRTGNVNRTPYGVIPLPGTHLVIFSRRPIPKPPVYSTVDIALNTALLLFVLIFTAFMLIYPIIKRIRAIEDTCQKVSNGDYKARCGDKKEDSIGILAQHIDDMTASIERHLSQQKSILQAVSHELRTPLSRIRFSIEMIDIPEDDDKSLARLESIDDDLTEIDNLIKELGYFNYVDAGKGKQHFEISAVKDLIDMTLQQRSLSIEKLNVTLNDIDENMMIEADPTAFKRVIGNLISNASRYASTQIRIEVEYCDNKKLIQICVDDDGPGIPEDKRASIFEPFVCLEKSRSKSMSGCGLGLAIADRIMKVHSGSIEVLDSPLGGARMRTLWPVNQTEPR